MCGGGGSQQVGSTIDQATQQQINANLWNYYQSSYKPLIEKWTAKVTSPDVQAAEKRQVAGEINAEVMRNVDPAKVSQNPVQNTRQMANLAAAGSGAQVQGQGGVRSRQLSNVQNVIDIGRGQATQADVGLGEVAAQSVRAAISSKDIQEQEQAAIENTYGSVAGTIAAGMLKYGSSSPRALSKNPISGVRE